jgi:hypothetical protein
VRQSGLSCYAIELKVFMRVAPHIAIVRTVEPLARIGYSALEVSVWRRVFTFFRFTFSWPASAGMRFGKQAAHSKQSVR